MADPGCEDAARRVVAALDAARGGSSVTFLEEQDRFALTLRESCGHVSELSGPRAAGP